LTARRPGHTVGGETRAEAATTMHIGKSYRLFEFLDWTRRDIYVLIVVAVLPTVAYQTGNMKWLGIPWTVVALLGTATAFIVGFTNVQTYNRTWEARQIWADIISSSRAWGTMIRDSLDDPEKSKELVYRHLFSMDWSLITPPRHPLTRCGNVRLGDIVPHPLIMYERGSTGRQHVAEAFQRLDLAPHVEIEATNTDLIVRMVEAGLGVGVVPLHPSGAVTRGRRVIVQSLGRQVRPIDSGVLLRRGDQPPAAAAKLLDFFVARAKSP